MLIRKRFISFILLIFFSNFLVGCYTVGNKQITRDDTLSKIKVGESTKSEVKGILGKPDLIKPARPDAESQFEGIEYEERWDYFYSQVIPPPTFYLGLIFFPLLFVGSDQVEINTLTILFSKDGVVKHLGKIKTTDKAYSGKIKRTERTDKVY